MRFTLSGIYARLRFTLTGIYASMRFTLTGIYASMRFTLTGNCACMRFTPTEILIENVYLTNIMSIAIHTDKKYSRESR